MARKLPDKTCMCWLDNKMTGFVRMLRHLGWSCEPVRSAHSFEAYDSKVIPLNWHDFKWIEKWRKLTLSPTSNIQKFHGIAIVISGGPIFVTQCKWHIWAKVLD